MPQCPQCGAELKDEYGMMQCPSCSAFLFIDMEGNAFIGSSSTATEIPADSTPVHKSTEPEVVIPETPAIHESSEPLFGAYADEGAPSFEPPPIDNSAPSESAPTEGTYDFGGGGFVSEASKEEAPVEEAPQDFAPLDFEPAPAAGEALADVVPDLGPANDPLGLSAYGNSEISTAKNGPILFRILISGIDTKEIRASIREVLEDSRFGWDSQAVMGQLSRGKLTIERLSPVKAMILINQIKRLPVTVRWEQNAVTQMESP